MGSNSKRSFALPPPVDSQDTSVDFMKKGHNYPQKGMDLSGYGDDDVVHDAKAEPNFYQQQ
jgi:hypothetical protein